MMMRKNVVRGLAVAAALMLAGAGVSRADTPIDPQMYLPELKKGDSMFMTVVKLPPLLKIEAIKKFREEHKLDKEFAKEIANVTIDDIAELVILGSGNMEEGAPRTVGLIRFTKDVETKDIAKDAAKLGDPQKISGYEVFAITETDEATGAKETTYLTKVAPATFAIMGSGSAEKDVSAYLKQIAAKKPGKYPEAAAKLLKGAEAGEVTVVGSFVTDDESTPEAFALTIKAGDTVKIMGSMKFKTAEAAADFADKAAKGSAMPIPLPNAKVKTDGDVVSISGSASKEEIAELVEGIGKMMPMGE